MDSSHSIEMPHGAGGGGVTGLNRCCTVYGFDFKILVFVLNFCKGYLQGRKLAAYTTILNAIRLLDRILMEHSYSICVLYSISFSVNPLS